MSVYAGDVIEADFELYDPLTLEMADPDDGADFTGTVRRNGADTTVEVTLVRRTNPGEWTAIFTIPTTWQRGDTLALRVLATVSDLTNTATVWNDSLSAGTTRPDLAGGVDTTQEKNPDHFGGADVKAKRPTITIRAGYFAQVRHQLYMRDGRLFNLVPYGFSDSEAGGVSEPAPHLVVNITEVAGVQGEMIYADLLSLDESLVAFDVPDSVSSCPGIWLLEFAIIDANNDKIFVTDAYLYVERSAGAGQRTGAPALPEVRLFLRDFAQENELIDVVDFDASEVALAASMCVDEWNELDPQDGPRYTTASFPYRRNWLVGISAYLFRIAAEHYSRNAYPYQAGGIAADDKGKFQLYMQRAEMAKQEWRQFIAQRKTLASVLGGFAEIRGIYGW